VGGRAHILAAAVVLGAALTLPPAARAKPRCKVPRGAAVVAESKAAIVYSRPRKDTQINEVDFIGCRRSLGIARKITYTSGDVSYEAKTSLWRLADRYVGYSLSYCTHYGDCTYNVYGYDLKRGRVVLTMQPFATPRFTYPPVTGGITALVVSPRGNIAYIVVAGDTVRVGTNARKGGGAPERTLDEGSDLDSSDLRLSNGVLMWTHGGQPRSAPLR
jgi:hypothetical protein